MKLLHTWQSWLFQRDDLHALGLCRILWALAMLLAVYHESGLWKLYSEAQYHVPLFAWAVPLPEASFRGLIIVAAIGGSMALLGLWSRLGVCLIVCALGYLFALDLLLFRNHIYLGLLIGLLLALSPAGRALSLDAALARWRGRPLSQRGPVVTARLISAQVAIVYGLSVVNKLRRPFLDGYVLERELPFALRGSPIRRWVCDAHGDFLPAVSHYLHCATALAVTAWLVVLAEAFLAIGLPSKRLCRYAAALGVALHLGIFLCMGIHVFGLLMVSAYPLFCRVVRGDPSDQPAAVGDAEPRGVLDRTRRR